MAQAGSNDEDIGVFDDEKRKRDSSGLGICSFAQNCSFKERLWANHSRHSLMWATMSKSLLSLCKKERHEWFPCDLSKSLSKTSNSLNKIHIFHMFSSFSLLSPFFMTKSESLLSLFAQLLFLKSDWSDSLLLLFTKELPWGNNFRCSLQKSDREQITL